jgi:hypothetical protein
MNNINQAGVKLINLGNGIVWMLVASIICAFGPFLVPAKVLVFWFLFWGVIELILVAYVVMVVFEAGKLLRSWKHDFYENQEIKKEVSDALRSAEISEFIPSDFPKLVADLNSIRSQLQEDQGDLMIEFLLSMARSYSIPKQLRERNIDLANRLTKLPISSFTNLYDKKKDDLTFIECLEDYLIKTLK